MADVYPLADSPVGNIASLAGKVALVTGGSSGLGRAICQAYAAAGAWVVSADLDPKAPRAPIVQTALGEDLTTPTVELINQKYKRGGGDKKVASFVQCDVSDEASVAAAVAFAAQTYGRLDIMVNNAGISAESQQEGYDGVFKRIHETDVKVLDQTYGVNIRGVWLGIKYAAAQFLKQEPLTTGSATAAGGGSGGSRGWIINMASVLGSVGLAGASTYCASKGAVLQLTKAAALEYAADGVHVNAVQPGFTDTHILEAMFEKGGRDPVAAHLTGLHPLGRLGRPADIAKMCVFLAGPGASWITGGHFAVDGGYLAQ